MNPGRNPTTVRRRLVALTGTLAAFVALALVLVVQVVLQQASSGAVSRVLEDRAEAVISSTESSTTGSSLEVPAARLDPGVAVYDAQGRPVAGTVPPSLQATFDRLSGSTEVRTVGVDDAWSVRAEPFALTGGASGVVVLAEPLAPYERDERAALAVSVVAGALMVLLAVVVAAWISRQVLVPVQAMAVTAREWSEHDLERRFDLGPPTDEIRALGRTLDGLLERVASAIRAEQRLTSELAHELRSPLTSVQATAELALMRPDLDDQLRRDLEDVLAGCWTMAATVTVLLDIARRDAEGATTGTTDADGLASALTAWALEVRLPDDLLLSVPRDVALRVLAPVLDNALAAGRTATLDVAPAANGQVTLRVRDDGPGVDPALADRIFDPGTTGTGGSGLGLPLARRVARSVGGDVRLVASAGPGATFEVLLPGHATPVRS